MKGIIIIQKETNDASVSILFPNRNHFCLVVSVAIWSIDEAIILIRILSQWVQYYYLCVHYVETLYGNDPIMLILLQTQYYRLQICNYYCLQKKWHHGNFLLFQIVELSLGMFFSWWPNSTRSIVTFAMNSVYTGCVDTWLTADLRRLICRETKGCSIIHPQIVIHACVNIVTGEA